MLKKLAIFVDWENIRKNIFEESARQGIRINYNDIPKVITFVKTFVDTSCEEIYRIFFYTALPYSGSIKGIDYTKTKAYSHATHFIETLGIQEQIALRKGIMKHKGFDSENQPIFIQKQVDMLLGLDIAHVSYNKLVDRILILTGDTDIIPAMKVARINGIQVVVGYCSDLQKNGLSKKLLLHTDFIRDKQFKNIEF